MINISLYELQLFVNSSRLTYVRQRCVHKTIGDANNLIERWILLPRYKPEKWKMNSSWLVNLEGKGYRSPRILVAMPKRMILISRYVFMQLDCIDLVWGKCIWTVYITTVHLSFHSLFKGGGPSSVSPTLPYQLTKLD